MMQVHQEEPQQNSASDNVKYIIEQYDWNTIFKGEFKDWMYSKLKYFVQRPDGVETEETVLDQLIHYAEMHELPHLTPLQESIQNCLSTPIIAFEQLKMLLLYLQDLQNAISSLKNNTKVFKITSILDQTEQVQLLKMNHDGTKILLIDDNIKILLKGPTGQWNVGPIQKRLRNKIDLVAINKDFTTLAYCFDEYLFIWSLTDDGLKLFTWNKFIYSMIWCMCFNEDSSVFGISYRSMIALFRFEDQRLKTWKVIRDIGLGKFIFAMNISSTLIAVEKFHSVWLCKLGGNNTFKLNQKLAINELNVTSLQFYESSRQLVANTQSNKIYTWILGINQQWKIKYTIKFPDIYNIFISADQLGIVIFEKKFDQIVVWKPTQQKSLEESINIDLEVNSIVGINKYAFTLDINECLTVLVKKSKLSVLVFREAL